MTEPYLIVERDFDDAPAPVRVPPRHAGVAIVFRNYGRVSGFCMFAAPGGSEIPAGAIEEHLRAAGSGTVTRSAGIPSLTVAVCTRDRPEMLQRCLESILALRVQPFETLVIDNAPTDDRTGHLVRGMPGVRYRVEPRPGLSFARNRAIQEASGAYVAYVDDDAIVDRGWLDALGAAWAENPDAAAFSGPILPFELVGEAQIVLEGRGGFGHTFRKARFGATLPGSRLYPCGAACFGGGGNMVLRRDAVKHIGGFDDALGSGTPALSGEDLDIFYRLVRAGYTWVYEPGLAIFHQHRRDLESLRRQVRSWSVGNVAYMAKAWVAEPEQRPRIALFLARLFARKAGGVVASGLGLRRYRWPVRLAVAEFSGVVEGLMGAYGRSRRKVEERRRSCDAGKQSHEAASVL